MAQQRSTAVGRSCSGSCCWPALVLLLCGSALVQQARSALTPSTSGVATLTPDAGPAAFSASAIVQAIQELVSGGLAPITTLTIPQGTYTVAADAASSSDYHVPVVCPPGHTAVALDLQGVTLLFGSSGLGGLSLTNCSGMVVQGATLGWAVYPFSQGTVSAMYPVSASFDVNIHLGYPSLSKLGNGAPPPAISLFVFDAITHLPKVDVLQGQQPSYAREPAAGQSTYVFDDALPANVQVGDLVAAFSSLGQHALLLAGCDGVSLTNVSVVSSPNACISELDTGPAGTTLVGLSIVRPAPGFMGVAEAPLLTCLGNGVQSTGAQTGPQVYNSSVGFVAHDGIVVRGEYLVLARVDSGDRELLMVEGGAAGLPGIGDDLAFFDAKGTSIGNATSVMDVQPAANPFRSNALQATGPVTTSDLTASRAWTFAVEPWLPAFDRMQPGSVAQSPHRVGSYARLHDVTVSWTLGRCVLVRGSYTHIWASSFVSCGVSGVTAGPSLSTGSAGFVTDLLIEESTFSGVAWSLSLAEGGVFVSASTSQSPDNSGIVVTNNQFVNISSCNVDLTGAANSVVSLNTFEATALCRVNARPGPPQPASKASSLVWATGGSSIVVAGNSVLNMTSCSFVGTFAGLFGSSNTTSFVYSAALTASADSIEASVRAMAS